MILYKFSMQAETQQVKTPLWQLFASFFKIGAFTFGGGWAMISIIEREIVDKYHWIERDDFLDLLAVAQSLPGILAHHGLSVTSFAAHAAASSLPQAQYSHLS